MKLTLKKREGKHKSELTAIRNQGDIPAIVYLLGKEGHKVTVDGREFTAIIRNMQKGHLPTTVFEIEVEGKKQKAIVKEIQYHKATYQVLHIDFQTLDDKTHVEVKVPVEFTGVTDAVGIKLGGFLREVRRHVTVRCLPKQMPSHFTLDVQSLGLNQAKRVRDIQFPEGVRCLQNAKEIVAVIAKK